jgi:hypothetical protein
MFHSRLLTNASDRVEVEWKYLLALDPLDSERPKPSANAKPLPDHLKENDTSLAISNRTDGVPEMGDSFHDPSSEHKWAEFNTAPEVTSMRVKVNLSKPDTLWYYLGKTSTEARPQYTEDPARPKNNPKASFLSTVAPAPAPTAFIDRRSYPASYPIKPSPISIPRVSLQPQIRPSDKPYQYKPRIETTYRSPSYNYAPSTRENPNSPVAHQPNVVYDHRAMVPQYNYPSYPTAYHSHHPPPTQTHTFHHYSPPQGSPGWKPPMAGNMLNGIDQYAQAGQPLPPYPYYPNTSPNTSRQLPPFPYSQPQGPAQRPVYSPPTRSPPASSGQSGPRTTAPLTSIMGNPVGTSKPPMYAHASPSSVTTAQSPPSQTEYIAYVTKYPYLKNAFLRRAKTYVSPYSPNGGFTPEWMPKPANGSTSTQSIAPRPTSHGPMYGYGSQFNEGPPNLPPPRVMPQFQSPDAFQRDMAKAPTHLSTMPKWDSMMKQLASSTAGPPQPSAVASANSALRTPPQLPSFQHLPQEMPKNTTPPSPPAAQNHAPNTPLGDSQRPIPSPISDTAKSPRRPEYSPISDNGKGVAESRPTLPPFGEVGQLHSGATWEYSTRKD